MTMALPDYPALVLNADMAPVSTFPLSVWDFGRAMRASMAGRVSVLSEYDAELRSANLTWRPPSVVMLNRYVRPSTRVSFTRMNVFLRDRFTCQYCGETGKSSDLTFDHVVPRAAGGRTNWDNIVAACVLCNSRKGSRLDMRPLRAPYQPEARELMRRKIPRGMSFHESWIDYLYWSGVLETE